MKCVFIVYNQANTERVEYMLDELGIRGRAGLRLEYRADGVIF